MKVLCLSSVPAGSFAAGIRAGEVYTRVDTLTCRCGRVWYELAEISWTNPPLMLYCVKCNAEHAVTIRPGYQSWRFAPWQEGLIEDEEKKECTV